MEPRPITVGANNPSPFSPWHLEQYFTKTFFPASASCPAAGSEAVGVGEIATAARFGGADCVGVGVGIVTTVGAGVGVGVVTVVGAGVGASVGAVVGVGAGVDAGSGVAVGRAQALTNNARISAAIMKLK